MKTVQIKPRLRLYYTYVLNVLAEFNADFMIGLFIGVLVISMVIFRFNNLNYALTPYGQFHLISVDLFFLLMPVAYYLFRFEPNNGKRVLASGLFPLLVFSLHDMAWLIETFWVPQTYLNGVTLLSASFYEYSYHFSKNIINVLPSLAVFLKFKYFKISKWFLLTFSGMVLFHALNILFKINLYVLNGPALILMETIDIIPYLLLIRHGPKTLR